jgi:hypothetical protein
VTLVLEIVLRAFLKKFVLVVLTLLSSFNKLNVFAKNLLFLLMANVSLWNKGVLILFSLTLIKQFVKAVLLGAKAVGISKRKYI